MRGDFGKCSPSSHFNFYFTMSTGWEFLEPWRAVLSENMTTVKQRRNVLFRCSSYNSSCEGERRCSLQLPVDAGNHMNTQTQRIGQAMELFTILSVANNRVFKELMPVNVPYGKTSNEDVSYPSWSIENLPSNLSDMHHSPVTWSSLLGFSDDLSDYSEEFWLALQKLESMGRDGSDTSSIIRGNFEIYWEVECEDFYTCGRQESDAVDSGIVSSLNEFRKLLRTKVPPIVQLCAIQRDLCLGETAKKSCSTGTRCEVSVSISNIEMAKSTRFPQIVGTSASKFDLRLGGHIVVDSPQVTTNASILLNEILCCHNDHNDHLYGKLKLSCFSISNGVFCSICSAVAELSAQSRLSNLSMDMRGRGRWQWLIYGLCCGASNTDIPSVEVLWGTLTKSDISIIADVLRVSYPLPAPNQAYADCIYGVVNLQAGVRVHLCDFPDDEHAITMISISCRCRAVYDPNNGYELVNFVVPGYGACVAKLGGAVQFTPDSSNTNIRVKPLRGSLALKYTTIETPEVLLDLLTMITSGLRTLKLYGHHEYTATQIHLDLCALATACPKLRELSTSYIHVVVSSHDIALRRWPIKCMDLSSIQQISDLPPCLDDRTTRMAHELVELKVSPRWHEIFDKEEVKKLEAHNGAFLSVVKEKFPLPLKIAMISVVTSTCSTKAIQRMDAYLLSDIFVLASTPEQRVIKCCAWYM